MTSLERIAIVGWGGVFPGAADPDAFWRLIAAGRDAGRTVPRGRWALPPEVACVAGELQPDCVYSGWGCFIEGFELNPSGLRLDHDFLASLDPLCHLALQAARDAFRAGGCAAVDPARIGVILGAIALPTESTSARARDVLGRQIADQVFAPGTAPWSTTRWHPRNRFAAGLPAALVAQAFGLGGAAWTLDAACASSLYALKFAADELQAGRLDAVLAGGLSRPDCQYTQMGFGQLQALSKRGRCAPLSAAADGLVVGEGAGVFVLKRLSDALAAGDTIYATIAGIGLSNDRGGSLLAPRSEGQLRAMHAAYAAADWQPESVELIECHATGTPVGDAVEIESAHQLWHGRSGRAVLGSVKSNVGHLLTGAGAAGMLKVLQALRHETLPPTANFAGPAAGLQRAGSPFRVLAEADPWEPHRDGSPRRAAVNAFGFGGINAHVLVEEWNAAAEAALAPRRVQSPGFQVDPPAIAIIGLAARVGTAESADEFLAERMGRLSLTETPPRWWGVEQSRSSDGRGPRLSGIAETEIPLGEFRIPPLEIADMLPQQQWMLQVAAEALADAGQPRMLENRTGVFVGIELDPNTTNFHVRWMLEPLSRQWADQLGLELTEEQFATWVSELRDRFGPPLTPNRVMGNLGGIVASRLAREFDVGGPCFTISGEETSGLHALRAAVSQLQTGELDRALVGSVELATDVRLVLAALADGVSAETRFVDASAAFVLKRLDDAVRDGDRVHAVIRGIREETPRATRGRLHGEQYEFSTAADDLYAGAATGMLQFLSGVLALSRGVLPAGGDTAQPWLSDRQNGPRQLDVTATPTDGPSVRVLLEEGPVGNLQREQRPAAGIRTVLRQGLFAFSGVDRESLQQSLSEFESQLDSTVPLDRLARRRWFEQLFRSDAPLGAAIVARDVEELRAGLSWLQRRLAGEALPNDPRLRAWLRETPVSAGELVFVFPGSGNHFLGMGRELLAAFPSVLLRQHAENEELRGQYQPDLIWIGPSTEALGRDHKAMIFGQVALGTAICDLLATFGVRPQASIGYSLGESAALFGLRAWQDRDEMLHRMRHSPLFGSDLVAPFDAARAAWGVPAGQPVPWLSGMVDRSADAVRSALAGLKQAYLLIVNTPAQCVVGGDRSQVEELIRRLGATFVPLATPSTVHCSVLRQVEPAYRELHLMRTTPPAGVRFYSTAWGRSYELNRESAAEAIVAQAVETIDFPAVVRQAHHDGVRRFLEIGPGASCTRMVDEILRGEPVWTAAVCPATADPLGVFLQVLAQLLVDGVPVDLSPLYGSPPTRPATTRMIRTPVGGAPYEAPPLPAKPTRRPSFPAAETCHPRTAAEGVPLAAEPAVRSADSVSCDDTLWPQTSCTTDNSVPAQPATAVARADEPPEADVGDEVSPTNGYSSSHTASSTPVRVAEDSPVTAPLRQPLQTVVPPTTPDHSAALQMLRELVSVQAAAHAAYLQVARQTFDLAAAEVARQTTAISPLPVTPAREVGRDESSGPTTVPVRTGEPRGLDSPCSAGPTNSDLSRPTPVDSPADGRHSRPDTSAKPEARSPKPAWEFPQTPPRSLNREQCLEFAIGQIGRVLGEQFAGIDANPTRVRLPDEPLMLVDRILEIDGEPLSMTSGRVVTEHDIHSGAWYLDCGRIPTCIAVESGQADLFLSGWLGIDLQTRGKAVYRLLDAVVTFHRPLPGVGETIHYDIKINHFFRQGETYLFRFEFDATVNGEPLLTMREGCAGFFSEAELAGGKGIIHSTLDKRPQPGKLPADWSEPCPLARESYSDAQLTALRRGDLAGCFGGRFAGLPLQNPVTLPDGRMRLVDRVLSIEPGAGKYGLGVIRAEMDIHADAWFLTCHFCDDQVMPGTLMYECCLHTLRIYLLRLGWVGEASQIAYEPIPGVRSRLKCRGQVVAGTQKVWYEVTIKELGYGGGPSAESQEPSKRLAATSSSAKPEARSPKPDSTPYCLADALMYADGKPIVEITDMSVRLSGLTREVVDELWRGVEEKPIAESQKPNQKQVTSSFSAKPEARNPKPALFNTDRITAFAIGKPSDAFGDRYKVFDDDRKIARLPGPPFQFLDRIVSIENCEAWKLQAGGVIVAEYDVPPDAWYFAANQQPRMPFAVLLETALQPCGWLAGYLGSALTSDVDLSFRNLGGTATQHRPVTADSGMLATTVKITRVSQSAGMIIQHFDFDLRCHGEPVYTGNTYFGFFSKAALANQVGIRDAKRYEPSRLDMQRAESFPVPTTAPFATERFRMITDVDQFVLDGGPHAKGFVRGSVRVDPDFWFFKAHFYQDPVWPGSLGLESFLQLLKVYAHRRWDLGADAVFQTVALNQPHEWIYRGQVIPRDRTVTVDVVVTDIDDAARLVTAAGFLVVDGRVIYEMKKFTLQVGK